MRARPLEGEKEPRNANVQVGNSLFGVKVVAAKYESSDTENRIVDFYRNELKTYGEVLECRGNVNYHGGRPTCQEKAFEDDLQLVAGPEDNQRIVAVKPRGDRMLFIVEDEGASMTEEVREAILNQTETPAISGRERGAGLGLAIVRSFVNLHGGTISIERREPRGSRVTVNLPRDASMLGGASAAE